MISDNARREYIRQAVEAGRTSFSALSKLIGKNHAYVQQYVDRGVPQSMRERDWKIIEASLTGRPARAEPSGVDVYAFKPGLGGGGVVIDESPAYKMPIAPEYARKNRLNLNNMISVEVEGDSMSPHLESGDQIMIDTADKNPARGGIFALTINDTVVVKRLEIMLGTDPLRLKLISSNPEHNPYDVLAEESNILGRVVWFARRM